ncbi:UvrD-helicase domain-containing protein [Candidatus Protochlamydia sp. R18]|uniref:UvrD-helicase domain-containing protein n=1 Tax=Candidatus Protochlamydia sp. R18 TaxID=1353977 RepID=UPI0006932894|nr:UvrD-helicase domain-containing protein [Candidatus Protochlamydia sp. R18]
MKNFNVLDRQLILHQHYLLEASAGTGKTFSIQNIVVRLLIENQLEQEALPLSKILVVTFTKAATRDLKLRIRLNIEYALEVFNEWISHSNVLENTPDYLKAVIETGIESVLKAKKKLQQALFEFDQAQIFTIHAFCARMLRQYAIESDIGFHASYGEETFPPSEILAIIQDFFRTEIRLENFSPAQLEIILKHDPDQKKLLRAIQSGYEFEELPTFQQIYQQFLEGMQNLQRTYSINSSLLMEDFQAQAPFFRNYKGAKSKADTLIKISRFVALFDQTEWTVESFDQLIGDGLEWVLALDPTLLKNPAASFRLNYPGFTALLHHTLERVVYLARDESILIARLAKACQKLLRNYQREEEKLSPDDLLRKMDWAIGQENFLKQIQMIYQAAIIDEFQDTDPLQWQIFRRLFLPQDKTWKGYLYLVGDPKQSIYSFRQADIYTYLAAAQALGHEHCFSLDVNYRSQPALVNALNVLFSPDHTPKFIPLPKTNFHLTYQPVFASTFNQTRLFEDEKGAVHFFMGDGSNKKNSTIQDLEQKVFFPFIAQEIRRLRKQKTLAYSQFAVLVRDRYQALRLAEYFDSYQLPYLNQRGTSLAESPALNALIDLIKAVLHPQNIGTLRTLLGNSLIGWSHEKLHDSSNLESILSVIQSLKQVLIEQGFSIFYDRFLQSCWEKNKLSILEQLLAKEGGVDFYHDLQQIAEIVINHQYHEWNGPEGLIPFLDQFQKWDENEDPRVKRFQDPSKDGIKILTLHVSKGLEFDIVFALGLIQRNSFKDELIPIEKEGKFVLIPLEESSEQRLHYCEEIDAEKMRQLYVAMTRAKYQLYIPISLHIPSEQIKYGEASPLDLLLGRLGQTECSYETLYDRIRHFNGQSFIKFMEEIGSRNGMTYSIHREIFLEKNKKDSVPFIDLEPPKSISILRTPLLMSSFSSLNRISSFSLSQTPPHDFNNSIKTEHTLPASSETGILIHELLEKISFRDFKGVNLAVETLPLIRPWIQNEMYRPWENVLAALVYQVLNVDLGVHSSPFCLADIEPSKLVREMTFLFPYESDLAIEGLVEGQGLIKGFIDLIFVHKGKYYIVDWKSNWLGSSNECYDFFHLHQAMLDHNYFVQAKIYTEALKRYLKLVETRSFEECFGGFFYLFLRGIQSNKQSGIYFCDAQDLIKIFSPKNYE